MSRAWSHWPTKLRTNSADRGSASIRSTWAWQVRAELVLAGQADQLVVGHGRPEEVRQPRGQGVFVDQRDTGPARPARPPPRGTGTAARPARPPSPGRRPPRRSAPPGRRRLGQRREPVHRRVVHGAAEGPRRRTGPAARGRSAGARRRRRGRPRGRSARNPAAGPSTRSSSGPRTVADWMRSVSDRTCFSSGVSGWTSTVSVVRPGLPVAIELEAERLPVLPDEVAGGRAPRRRPGRRAGIGCSRLTPST